MSKNLSKSGHKAEYQLLLFTGELEKAMEKIEKGEINVNQPVMYGTTLLHLAAGKGDMKMVHALVVKYGANMQATDDAGVTAAMEAKKNGHAEISAILNATQLTIDEWWEDVIDMASQICDAYLPLMGSADNGGSGHIYESIPCSKQL